MLLLTEVSSLSRTSVPPNTCLWQTATRDGRKFQRSPFGGNQVCAVPAQPIIGVLFWGETMPEDLTRERCTASSDRRLAPVKFHKCCRGSKLQLWHEQGFLATFPQPPCMTLMIQYRGMRLALMWQKVVSAESTLFRNRHKNRTVCMCFLWGELPRNYIAFDSLNGQKVIYYLQYEYSSDKSVGCNLNNTIILISLF